MTGIQPDVLLSVARAMLSPLDFPAPCANASSTNARAGRPCVSRRAHARAVLYTISFQAQDFYRKQGYEAFGEVPCEPDGASRVFMVKVL